MEVHSITNFNQQTLKNLFCLAHHDHHFYVNDHFEAIYMDAITSEESYPISSVATVQVQNVGILLSKVAAESVFIQALGVIQSHRRMGIATMMVHELLNACRVHKFKNIKLEVPTTNKNAFSLYTSLGFYVSHRVYCFQGYLRTKRFKNLIINKCTQNFDSTKLVLTDCYESKFHDHHFSISYEVLEKDEVIGLFSLNKTQTEVTSIQTKDKDRTQIAKVICGMSYLNLFLKIVNVPEKNSELLEILMNSEMKLYCEQFRMKHELI